MEATSHNDHYMINMGGQTPKIGGIAALICSAGVHRKHPNVHTVVKMYP